ncbi:MAG: rod-binding protein [Parvibaculum sp.]
MTIPVSALGPSAFDLDRIVKSPRVDVSASRAAPPPVERFANRAIPLPDNSGGALPEAGGRAYARIQYAPAPTIESASPHHASDPMWKAAQEFEAVMLAQMFDHMFKGLETNTLFGGGHAESIYRSFLMQTIGEAVAKSGGVGIAELIHRDMARAYGAANSGEWG